MFRTQTFALAVATAISVAASAASNAQTKPAAAATIDAPPTARTVDVVDHEFGLILPDPYRWMEGENNAEFNVWLKAQGEYTRGKLRVVEATVPLERMFDYAEKVRSLTQGRASWSMEPHSYAPAPDEVLQSLLHGGDAW